MLVPMIELHRLHGNGVIVVNADLIESVESTPDTVVSLVTKRRFVVEDSVENIIEKIVSYRARIAQAIPAIHDQAGVRALSAIDEQEQAA